MEIEHSDSYFSLLLLLGGDDSEAMPLLERNVTELLNSAPSYCLSHGQQCAQHRAVQCGKEGHSTRMNEPLTYTRDEIDQETDHVQRDGISTKIPEKFPGVPQGGTGLNIQWGEGRSDIVGRELPIIENILPSPTRDHHYAHVPEDEVSIRVEIQSILCGLTIGTELRDYTLIAAALKPLAYKLKADVLVTGGGDRGYDNPGTTDIPNAFNIHDDKSILTMGHHGNRGVVISTPEMKNSQWETIIPEMTQILGSSFKMTFNNSTGLNVHIGIGRAYTLQDTKRISKAIILFEKQMDTYHPKSRSPVLPALSLNYSQILPCRSSPYLRRLTDAEVMREINAVKSIPKLIQIMNRDDLIYGDGFHRCYRYNLREIISSKTIEFRQAIGTVQSYKILDWIKKVTMFVKTAVVTLDSEFDSWAEQGIVDLSVYYRFGVPPPALKGRPLVVRIPIPKRRTRVLLTPNEKTYGKIRRKDVWLFEKAREGNVGRGLFWFVYRWRKISGGLSSPRRAGFFSSTVVVILGHGKDLAGCDDLGGPEELN